MDELIKSISEKVGIGPEQAKQAVDQVVGFLKGKLPGPIGDQIEGVLSGKTPDLGGIGDTLGGLFGKK